MRGSSHFWSVLIGIEYRNCCLSFDAYLGFAIWIGQIQSILLNGLFLYKFGGQAIAYTSKSTEYVQLKLNLDMVVGVYFTVAIR